mgnify:CR=1 FL=1
MIEEKTRREVTAVGLLHDAALTIDEACCFLAHRIYGGDREVAQEISQQLRRLMRRIETRAKGD